MCKIICIEKPWPKQKSFQYVKTSEKDVKSVANDLKSTKKRWCHKRCQNHRIWCSTDSSILSELTISFLFVRIFGTVFFFSSLASKLVIIQDTSSSYFCSIRYFYFIFCVIDFLWFFFYITRCPVAALAANIPF